MKSIFILLVLLVTRITFAQIENEMILFYNVENLFDTIDAPDVADSEFTPSGQKAWNSNRYWRKINQIGKVILAAGRWNPPVLVGLCEIENRNVLNDLVLRSPLKNLGYKIVHEESPDARGIDVALLYRENAFRELEHDCIRIQFPVDSSLKTRDILHVKGILQKRDTLHLFVNHWPSRRGGIVFSEPKRLFVSNQLKKKINRLPYHTLKIIMGDFNDEPINKSIINLTKHSNLFNPMLELKNLGVGSHKYKNEWGLLDQIIISNSLRDTIGVQLEEAGIVNNSFLLTDTKNAYDQSPFRTYQGPIYKGGYSDHLPVYLKLRR